MSQPPASDLMEHMADQLGPILVRKGLIPSLSHSAIDAAVKSYTSSDSFKTMARAELRSTFDDLVDEVIVEEINADLVDFRVEYRRDATTGHLVLCHQIGGAPVVNARDRSNGIPSFGSGPASKRLRTASPPSMFGASSGNSFASAFGGNPFVTPAPAAASRTSFEPPFTTARASVAPATTAGPPLDNRKPPPKPTQPSVPMVVPQFNPTSPTETTAPAPAPVLEFAKTSASIPSGSQGNLALGYFNHLRSQYDEFMVYPEVTTHDHQMFIMCQAYGAIHTFGCTKGKTPDYIQQLLIHHFASNDLKFRSYRLLENEVQAIKAYKYNLEENVFIFNMNMTKKTM